MLVMVPSRSLLYMELQIVDNAIVSRGMLILAVKLEEIEVPQSVDLQVNTPLQLVELYWVMIYN
jgi:hypothetical protein